ncbi:MAG TPA: sugar ABC transporter substrate-binding protein [Anaerolineae bacterium]|nr:sugar ABC transporter substrate-binding protein [Anaerolineae bacterium]
MRRKRWIFSTLLLLLATFFMVKCGTAQPVVDTSQLEAAQAAAAAAEAKAATAEAALAEAQSQAEAAAASGAEELAAAEAAVEAAKAEAEAAMKAAESASESVEAQQTLAEPGLEDATVIHLMSDEIAPESQDFYRKAAADFEALNPNVSISLDFQGNMDQALAIRVAAGEPPEIASMQLERLLYYADRGLLEPADWWFEKYGDDVVELASIPYKDTHWDIPYALTSEMWWYRQDLFEEAGIPRPETWEDMLAAAEHFNDPASDFYGIAIAAGPGEWTAWHYEVFLWQNGGFVFDTDLKPLVDSPESIEALNYLKELYQFSPPDASTWEWWDSIDAFVAERVAMSMYGGRLLVHTARDNPDLAPVTRVMDQPLGEMRAGPLSRKSHAILSNAPNKEKAKEFLDFMMQPEYLLPFLRTVPIHLTPPLKSYRNSPLYTEDPLIQSHLEDMEIVYEAVTYGRSLGWESPNHPPNPYSGAINSANILPQMIQKVLLEDVSPEEATAWAKAEIIKVQEQVDAERVIQE